MLNWFKKLFTKKQKYVSNKEIKEIYKSMSKNQLIRVINTLVTENAILKNKKIQNSKNKLTKESNIKDLNSFSNKLSKSEITLPPEKPIPNPPPPPKYPSIKNKVNTEDKTN